MPYIRRDRKLAIVGESTTDYNNNIMSAGELNYLITEYLVSYLDTHGLSYQTCNDIVGALDNCKDEFRRRVQHPYEDQAISRNGDVYPKKYTE
jgi:hypothetical protein